MFLPSSIVRRKAVTPKMFWIFKQLVVFLGLKKKNKNCMYKMGARERSNGTEKHEQNCYMPLDGDTELGHCMHGRTYSVI